MRKHTFTTILLCATALCHHAQILPAHLFFLQPLRLLDNLSVEEIDGAVGVGGIVL